LSRSADGASAGRGFGSGTGTAARRAAGRGLGEVTLNRSAHGAERDAFAAMAGPVGMPSSSATAATVTITGPMRPKAPLAHFRLAFSALEFISIP
jgi:hypothetical protein